MNTRKFRAVFLTLMVATLVAVPAAAQTAAEESSETPRTTVRVINDNWNDITVYAVRNGYRRLLGHVTSFTSRELTLPRTLLIPNNELRLIADPIGRRGVYVSEPLVVNAGDVVEWRLRNNIRLSNIFIYRF